MKRPLLLPLVPLYVLGLRIEDALRPAPMRLRKPVLSVGSLSAGGAGKTPVVLALAELLARHGISADVLSRGYGRSSGRSKDAAERVDPQGSAQRFGDEPLELAQAGLAVYVASHRLAAGRLAEQQTSSALHILDDGFQHRRLARSLDLVLLTAQDIRDHLLPAGNLREPLRALRRAHAILLRDNEAESLIPFVAQRTKAPVWIVHRELQLPPTVPTRPLAFCGLARPDDFFANLRAAGCDLSVTRAFPDHHPYTPQDIARLSAAAEHAAAGGFLTSAKDAVKLTPAFRRSLEQVGPVLTAPLRVTFLDEPAVLRTLQTALAPLP